MQITSTSLQDVVLISPDTFRDLRGFFIEIYNREKFRQIGTDTIFFQDNCTFSKQGVLRGLHYQYKHPQGKLIWVAQGRIFDVAVDLRKGSSTFGKYQSTILSQQNKLQLWLPPGFAHGYYVLSKSSIVIYKTTDYYDPTSEFTIIWNDPDLNIQWQLAKDRLPILSQKDAAGKYFKDIQVFE